MKSGLSFLLLAGQLVEGRELSEIMSVLLRLRWGEAFPVLFVHAACHIMRLFDMAAANTQLCGLVEDLGVIRAHLERTRPSMAQQV